MSSQSVVEGGQEPIQSRGYAPKSGDDVSMPEGSSTEQPARQDNPGMADNEVSARQSTSHGRSRAQQTRGSPPPSTRRNNAQLQGRSAGFPDVLRQTLKSDEMTSRACRLMITLAVSLAIVLVPVAAAAFIVMVKAPVDWKFMLSGGSAVFISLGSWFFGRRRVAKKSRRSPVTGSSKESAQDS
jgi:hypothetical protein